MTKWINIKRKYPASRRPIEVLHHGDLPSPLWRKENADVGKSHDGHCFIYKMNGDEIEIETITHWRYV